MEEGRAYPGGVMAHLRDITKTCAAYGCTSRATHQVYTYQNDPLGTFCRRHANSALKGRQKVEEQIFAEQRKASS